MTFLQRSSKSKDVVIEGVTVERESDTWEFGVGVNKTWAAGKIYPYVGAGLDYAKVDMTFHEGGTTASDDGNGFGFWGGAGACPSHPHPVFSPDSQRIYFNVGSDEWTRLYVAERTGEAGK